MFGAEAVGFLEALALVIAVGRADGAVLVERGSPPRVVDVQHRPLRHIGRSHRGPAWRQRGLEQKSRYFHYSGPGREGNRRFLSGECAMLTGESSLYAQARRAGIDVGILPLPHYDDVYAAKPADVLPDGAGLWVLAEPYRAAAGLP